MQPAYVIKKDPKEEKAKQVETELNIINTIKRLEGAMDVWRVKSAQLKTDRERQLDEIKDAPTRDLTIFFEQDRMDALAMITSINAGQVLLLGEFEKEFKAEWKQKKGQTLEKRGPFLHSKNEELKKFETAYQKAMDKASAEFDRTWLTDNDEVEDEKMGDKDVGGKKEDKDMEERKGEKKESEGGDNHEGPAGSAEDASGKHAER
ncbi:hypothetical protein EK21DRAFT_113505 [Setomelanomma holmii]|uniref:Uncharacterized protein n=1 Tax=Setomelanomma holmii TaxID=210430 RepID=A0A9P4H606_9PLEO|nr:hypothetical protein EK21DRAFT_113505 [Setomelanomma holmii]